MSTTLATGCFALLAMWPVRGRYAAGTQQHLRQLTATNSPNALTRRFLAQPTQLESSNAQITESGLQASSPALSAQLDSLRTDL
jgi:hypothetical protein